MVIVATRSVERLIGAFPIAPRMFRVVKPGLAATAELIAQRHLYEFFQSQRDPA
jgi:hypothetical protein